MTVCDPPFPAKAVANEFVRLGIQERKPVTILKLLKLVYFAHGYHYPFLNGPLIDEAIEAWKFGPVVPSLYHAFKGYGFDPITAQTQSVFRTDDGKIGLKTPSVPDEAPSKKLIEAVWGGYGKLDAGALVGLTHQAGGPWHEAWFAGGGSVRKGTDIPEATIKSYFEELSRVKDAA